MRVCVYGVYLYNHEICHACSWPCRTHTAYIYTVFTVEIITRLPWVTCEHKQPRQDLRNVQLFFPLLPLPSLLERTAVLTFVIILVFSFITSVTSDKIVQCFPFLEFTSAHPYWQCSVTCLFLSTTWAPFYLARLVQLHFNVIPFLFLACLSFYFFYSGNLEVTQSDSQWLLSVWS